MSTNKKYYWLKLKDNFFDSEEMVLLQSMQDGYLYSDILLKMYLKSLKTEGRLMLKDHIPYNANMIATLTRHSVGTVEKALNTFVSLGLIEVLDNQAIYMLDIQSLIGESSSEGDRKKVYREKIKKEQTLLIEGGHSSAFCPPEIEKDLELELEKEKTITSLNPLSFDNEKIIMYANIYKEITGKEHRNINKYFCFKDDDLVDAEEVFNHIQDNWNNGNADRCNIEYFNTILDRFR